MTLSTGDRTRHRGQQEALTETQENFIFTLAQTCTVTDENEKSQGCLSDN